MSTTNSGIAPADVKRERDVLALERSHYWYGDFAMLIEHDGRVYLTNQPKGEEPKERIEIPRHVFKRFVDWYLKPQGDAEK
jgi:hypothetical protein